MNTPASSATSATYNTISARESIYTGFLEYVEHSPADLSAYAGLQQSTWITFGSLRCLVDSRGTLRPTLAALRSMETPASMAAAPIAASSAVKITEIASTSTSASTSTAPTTASPVAKIASTAVKATASNSTTSTSTAAIASAVAQKNASAGAGRVKSTPTYLFRRQPRPAPTSTAPIASTRRAAASSSDRGTRHVAVIFDNEHSSDEESTTGSISPTRRVYPAQVYMAGPSAPVYPMEVTLQDKVTKLTITRELAIRAQKHVDDGTFPAPEDPQEDRQAVQYLLWKEAERIKQDKAELARRKELADESSARRAALSFMAGSEEVSQEGRHRARMPRVHEADRVHLTRNLESSFLEDEDGIPIPRTPASALMGVETYLRVMQPPEGSANARVHRQQIQALRQVEEALTRGEPVEGMYEERGRRDREVAPAADREPIRLRQLQPGEDGRNVVTQRRIDRARRLREAGLLDDEDHEPRGAPCFSINIRNTKMPKGFKLTAETQKYDGKQHPRDWLDDYLIACSCQGGNSTTAMQYIQLMLTGSARGWLNTQPKDAFRTWEEFRTAFIKGFLGTYARPTTLIELQACKQGHEERLRSYIQQIGRASCRERVCQYV